MKIPDHYLEHRIDIRPIKTIPGSTGAKYLPAVESVHALVVEKIQEVTDQRAETRGTAITSSTHILVQPEHRVLPGSLVTVWKGTPLEREGEVVAVALGKHSIAPESAQFWLV